MRKETKGYLFVILGATCLGTIGIFARLIYQHEPDPLTVVSWRALIAFFLLFITAVFVNPDWLRIRKKDFPFFAIYGLLSVSLCFLLFFYAIKYTTVATATILLYTYPAFVILLSPFTLGEKFTRSKILALLLTFLGCILVIQVYDPAGVHRKTIRTPKPAKVCVHQKTGEVWAFSYPVFGVPYNLYKRYGYVPAGIKQTVILPVT